MLNCHHYVLILNLNTRKQCEIVEGCGKGIGGGRLCFDKKPATLASEALPHPISRSTPFVAPAATPTAACATSARTGRNC